jgi:hypothetical protein
VSRSLRFAAGRIERRRATKTIGDTLLQWAGRSEIQESGKARLGAFRLFGR